MLKPIPDFPDYWADEMGNLYSTKPPCPRANWHKKPTLLHPNIIKGYRSAILRRDNKPYRNAVHYWVLTAFSGPRPNGMVCCHGPNGKLDNSIKNLRWGTISENMQDKYRDGTMNNGENHPRHIFNELQVRIIRRFCEAYGRGGNKVIADFFNTSPTEIGAIVKRRIWRHI